MCESAKHKGVCSKWIGPERVNTLPTEPHTHDPAGLSAPLNMTIHLLPGTCVCVYVLMFTHTDFCLHASMHDPSLNVHFELGCACALTHTRTPPRLVNWSLLSVRPGRPVWGLVCMDMCGNQSRNRFSLQGTWRETGIKVASTTSVLSEASYWGSDRKLTRWRGSTL